MNVLIDYILFIPLTTATHSRSRAENKSTLLIILLSIETVFLWEDVSSRLYIAMLAAGCE